MLFLSSSFLNVNEAIGKTDLLAGLLTFDLCLRCVFLFEIKIVFIKVVPIIYFNYIIVGNVCGKKIAVENLNTLR